MRFVIENPSTETTYNCRQLSYLDLSQPNINIHAFYNKNANKETSKFQNLNIACKAPKSIYFAKENSNTENAYNCMHFTYLDFSQQSIKKYVLSNRKPKYGNCLQLWAVFVFVFQDAKNKKICVLQQKTQVRKCRQFLYFNFSQQNTKKHAFCNRKQEYRNCPQFKAISVFAFQPAKHKKSSVLVYKTRIRKLPTFVGSFHIFYFSGQNTKKTCILQWII